MNNKEVELKFIIDKEKRNEIIEFFEIELQDNDADISTILNFVKKYGLTIDDVTYEGIQKIVQRLN